MPFDLRLDPLLHTNLVEINTVHEVRELFYKVFLAHVTRLTAFVLEPATAVVDIPVHVAILLLLKFLVGRYPRSTQATGEEFREGELFTFAFHRIVHHILLHLIEEFLRDDRRMLADIPLTSSFRVLEGAVVEGVAERDVYVADGERFATLRLEFYFVLEPHMQSSPTIFLVGDLLKHFLNDRCPVRVNIDVATLLLARAVQVSSRCGAWPQPHLASRSKSSFYIHHLVVILEFCLAPQYHEEEFLVRIVSEFLTIGTYLVELPAIHKINDSSEVPGIPRNAVGSPGQNATELATLDLIDYLIEYRSLSGFLCGVRFFLDFHDLKMVALCHSEHLLDLAVYREDLLFFALHTFPRVKHVFNPYRGLYFFGHSPDWRLYLVSHTLRDDATPLESPECPTGPVSW